MVDKTNLYAKIVEKDGHRTVPVVSGEKLSEYSKKHLGFMPFDGFEGTRDFKRRLVRCDPIERNGRIILTYVYAD